MHISSEAHGIDVVHSSISTQSVSSETPGWHVQINCSGYLPAEQFVPLGQSFKLVEQISNKLKCICVIDYRYS